MLCKCEKACPSTAPACFLLEMLGRKLRVTQPSVLRRQGKQKCSADIVLSSKPSRRYNSSYWTSKRIIHQGAQEVVKMIIIKYPEKGRSSHISQASNCFAQNQMYWSWGAELCHSQMFLWHEDNFDENNQGPKDLVSNFDLSHKFLKEFRSRACSPNGGMTTDICKDFGLSGGETLGGT